MTYKICQVVFSTNRLNFLIPTLQSQMNLNFYGCEVYKIFIDDYPKTRNNNLLKGLVSLYDYDEIILHEENMGLSASWSQAWEIIKDKNFDYVFHQEDDVEILEPVLITDLIEILEKDKTISQVKLARQPWYQHETEPMPLDNDVIYKNYRYQRDSVIFSPMASICPASILNIPYRDYYNFNLNEGMLGQILYDHYGMSSAEVKNFYGKNIIRHIGDWFVGKRVLPGEPGYDNFKHYDPDVKYNSKNGRTYEEKIY